MIYLVYGTLRKGQRANGIINTGDNFIGAGRITEKARLANLGGFPAICPNLVGDHQPVVEAYQVESPDMVQALDRYEGFPRLYSKKRMKCVINEQELEGVVYVMEDPNDTVRQPEVPDGDWLEVANA